MSNSRGASGSRDRNQRAPTTFVHGVGEVPSGPRGWMSSASPQSQVSYETIMPDTSQSSVTIKQEEEGVAEPEDGEVVNNVKIEDTEEAQPAELDQDYQNLFSTLLAFNARSTRSDTSGSSRQDTSDARLSRSEASVNSRSRDRSRSPRGSRSSRGSSNRNRTSSPLFVPDTNSRNSHSPFDDEDEIDRRCRCPIGYPCVPRPSDHIDCRPLVREYRSWTQSRDEETFECHRQVTSAGPRFVTNADLGSIVNSLNLFLTATTNATRNAAGSSISAWILDMEDVTITPGTQQDIVNQQVIPALTLFLSVQNEAVRRSRNLPGYVEEELLVLKRKWGKGDFDGDVKRGLLVREVFDVNGILKNSSYRVNENWPFYVSALYFGAGDLVNGQIWESRVELMRDGVHAPSVAGISGTAMGGARSVLLGAFDETHNVGYADIDMGEVIEYVGTALRDPNGQHGPTNVKDPHMSIPGAWDPNAPGEPTSATRAMFKSIETREPVRVIRSFKMCDIVTNKPTKGYRFDGMYRVVRATAMKQARQIWSFRMVREPDQLPAHGPLRGFAGGPRRREARGQRIGHFIRT